MTLLDLCSIAETCPSFKEIAERVFPRDLTVRIHNKSFLSNRRCALDAERIFRNFGSLLSAIRISGPAVSLKFVLNLLTTYCTYDTLKELDISNFNIRLNIEWKPIFNRLQKLVIRGVEIQCWDYYGTIPIFENCDSLIELQLYGVDTSWIILQNDFPKLERFCYESYEDADYERHLYGFISRHKRLKSLQIQTVLPQLRQPNLQIIVDNCTGLEKLTILITKSNQNDLSILQRLDRLKELEIELTYGLNATKCILQFEALKSLETLKVWRLRNDHLFIPELLRLKNLRKLHLYDCIQPIQSYRYFARLMKFHIKRLVNLEELAVVGNNVVLDEQTFSEIVKMVEDRPNVLMLKCKFYFSYDVRTGDKNRKVKLLQFEDCDYRVGL